MAFHLLHTEMIAFAASPQQETNMCEFQVVRAYRDSIFQLEFLSYCFGNFLEHRASLGIKHQAAAEPQCGYPKIWWQKLQKCSIYNHKTVNDVRSNSSSGVRTLFLKAKLVRDPIILGPQPSASAAYAQCLLWESASWWTLQPDGLYFLG